MAHKLSTNTLAPSLLGPLWTTSNARWGGYLCRWSSVTE